MNPVIKEITFIIGFKSENQDMSFTGQ